MKRLFLAIAATTVAMTGTAQAAQTTFAFDSNDNSKTSILKTLDGINMTIGNFSDPGTSSLSDADGLALFAGQRLSKSYSKFDITFDQPVKLISYNLTLIRNATGVSTTFAQNLLQSIQTFDAGTGQQTFNNQFVAQANVPILASSTSNANRLRVVQIGSLTVEKVALPPTAAPGPLPILGFGAAFGFSRRLRRRVSLSQGKGIPADA